MPHLPHSSVLVAPCIRRTALAVAVGASMGLLGAGSAQGSDRPLVWQKFTNASLEQSPGRTVHDGAGKVYLLGASGDRTPDVGNGVWTGAMTRLSEVDGSVDPTFALDRRYRAAYHAVFQPDGKIVVAVAVGDSYTVIRVDSTGEQDSSFAAPFLTVEPRFLTLQSDGKIVVAGSGTGVRMYRLLASGALDNSFPNNSGPSGIVASPPVIDPSGNIYIAVRGVASSSNPFSHFYRIKPDGNVDTNFPGSSSMPSGFIIMEARGFVLQSDGKPVLIGSFRSASAGSISDPVVAIRFNLDGNFDSSFGMPRRSNLLLSSGQLPRMAVADSSDRLLLISSRVLRVTASGAPDATFTPVLLPAEYFWLSRDSAGRIYIPDISSVGVSGTATSLNGNGVARLTSTGELDLTFAPGSWGRAAVPVDGAVRPDGGVWIGGSFNRVDATGVRGVAVFQADGRLNGQQPAHVDAAFSNLLAEAENGGAYVRRATVTGASTQYQLAKYDANGTEDASFSPAHIGLGTATLYSASGGKLVISEAFGITQLLNGTLGNALVRLLPSGAKDSTFIPVLSQFGTVSRNSTTNRPELANIGRFTVGQVLPSGGMLLFGPRADAKITVVRLLDNGAVDDTFSGAFFGLALPNSSFTTPITDPVTGLSGQIQQYIYTDPLAGTIKAVLQTASGKVYVGGRHSLDGRPRGLVRLNADGSFDSTFTGAGISHTPTDSSPYVVAMAEDSVGRIYVAGRFDAYNGVPLPGLFRLQANGELDMSWRPPYQVLDAPVADVRLTVKNNRLYIFGSVGLDESAMQGGFRIIGLDERGLDLNGNGANELIWHNRVTGAAEAWDPIAVSATSLGSRSYVWTAAAVADFDGDGRSDIIWQNRRTGECAVRKSDGTELPLFVGATPPAAWEIAGAADFDGDGKPDIVWQNRTSGERAVWLMDGLSYRSTLPLPTVPVEWAIVAVGDIDGDAEADLLWRHRTTGELAGWGMLRGVYARTLPYGIVGNEWQFAQVGDFDGDGHVDFAWKHRTLDSVYVWKLQNGRQQNTLVQTARSPFWSLGRALDAMRDIPRLDADLNSDGRADLLLWSGLDYSLLQPSVGLDSLQSSAFVTVHHTWRIAAKGDMNGDGTPDLVWENTDTGERVIWLLTPSGTGPAVSQQAVALPTVDNNWRIAGVADFNADGQRDVVWQNLFTGERGIWLMNGTQFSGQFVPLGVVTYGWHIVGVGDFTGDGKPDLLWRAVVDGTLTVWQMNGAVYQTTITLSTVPTNWEVADVADMDGDGSTDIVWQNRNGGKPIVWFMQGLTYLGSTELNVTLGAGAGPRLGTSQRYP